MKHDLFELPISKALVAAAERPAVTALYSQHDGTLLCGLSFCKPLLFRVKTSGANPEFEDLKIEDSLGKSAVAVTHGLRPNISGSTTVAVLHTGFMPGFLKGLVGGNFLEKSGKDLLDFYFENDGGMGAAIRHSILQISNNEVSVRRMKEPGAIIDVAHIGDFIFGLGGTSIWREPYLNSEKRETLRKDLGKNSLLHRDESGNFWFVGANERMQRMEQTDIKSKPTVLKLPVAEFEVSAASETDGWLYGSSRNSHELYRLRRNPVSHEEEMQKVASFEHRITGLVALDREESSFLLVCLEKSGAAEVHAVDLVKPEDPELPPPAAAPRILGTLAGISSVSSLTLDRSDITKKRVWGGESRMGSGEKGFQPTRLVQISDL